MNAKTIKGKSTKEIEIALKEAMSDGFEPTLATVFLSIKLDRSTICEILDQNSIQIFGPEISREIEGIQGVLDAPMAGFFCQGEFGRAHGGDLSVTSKINIGTTFIIELPSEN